jgi:TonB family protein
MDLKIPILVLASASVGMAQEPGLLETYQDMVRANPDSSLARYRLAEEFLRRGDHRSAAREYWNVLVGDLEPKWTEVWSYIGLGKTFQRDEQRDRAEQRERAINAYKRALETGDNSNGALEEAARNIPDVTTLIPPQESGDPAIPEAPKDRLVNAMAELDAEELGEQAYSPEARIAGLEGTVVLIGSVDASGAAAGLQLARGLGLGLDEQAMAAVRQWRFKRLPALGRPMPVSVTFAVDFLLPGKASRWHLAGVSFDVPAGGERPEFIHAPYPPGAGISRSASDYGRVIVAIGRHASVTLSFEVSESGVPANFEVREASDSVWGSEAIAVVREWRFKPGMASGAAMAMPCTVKLLWGSRLVSAEIFRDWYRRDLEPAAVWPTAQPTP